MGGAGGNATKHAFPRGGKEPENEENGFMNPNGGSEKL